MPKITAAFVKNKDNVLLQIAYTPLHIKLIRTCAGESANGYWKSMSSNLKDGFKMRDFHLVVKLTTRENESKITKQSLSMDLLRNLRRPLATDFMRYTKLMKK